MLIIGGIQMNKPGDRKRAKELNFKGHELYEWYRCGGCGKERWVIIKKGSVGSGRCHKCAQIQEAVTRVGEKHHAWKGGKRTANGYVMLYMPDCHKFSSMRVGGRYVFEHRLVMAEHLGRPLTKYDLVHHKDGTRDNNQLSNLELTQRGKHEKDHGKGYSDGFNKGYMDGLNKAKEEALCCNQNQ
jgi:hypothetical protein